jgi:hypothetical protein
LAYFEYGKSIDAAMAGLLLAVLFTVASLIALIPFAGFVIYLFVVHKMLGWFVEFTGFPSGLTVTVAYWLATVGALLANLAMSLLVVLYLKRR